MYEILIKIIKDDNIIQEYFETEEEAFDLAKIITTNQKFYWAQVNELVDEGYGFYETYNTWALENE